MKKLIESELISIAHRVLKLKNRSETKQLLDETKKLYEQLTLLHFYENHIALVEKEISKIDLEEKIATIGVTQPILETIENEIEDKPIETLVEEVINVAVLENETPIRTYEEAVDMETETKAVLDDEKIADVTSNSLFSNTLDLEYGKMPEFVRAEETQAQVAESIFEEEKKPVEKENKNLSLNDLLSKSVIIGLNDRIAFEKKLFNGKTDDFNRVLSQLNTFDSFEEASGFIETFVKPDYNNWEGNEEYETRFMELVAKKFN